MANEALAIGRLVISGFASLVFLGGCGGGSYQSINNQSLNPTPTITTLSPNSASAGGAAFTLTINGTNFVAASGVNFGGTARTITFVSATQLSAAIPATAIASVGTATVTVTNPAPGGGTSNAVDFTIGTNPVPTINALDPNCAPAGGQAFTLFLDGLNFVAGSVVRWNGSDRMTTLTSSGQLSAQISASDIAANGTAAVTVFNPAPGGGSSNTSTLTTIAGGAFPQSVAVDPTGRFAYVANQGCFDTFAGNVSMYTINPTTGVLTSAASPVAADIGAHSMTVSPSGKFAYVANTGNFDSLLGDVSMYTINATTGTLTSTGTIGAQISPYSVAVDPTGKFAYVPNQGGFSPTSVSMYTINTTTGALTPTGMIASGGRAISVAVDPTGKFAYVANGGGSVAGSVSMYTIDPTTGALTSIGTIAAGSGSSSIAIDPSGKLAFVTNSSSNNVSMYSINATTGALTSTGTIAAGTGPAFVAVDPASKFAYVSNFGSNNVSMYSINATTGALTSAGTIGAGIAPDSVAVDPMGKFAYVANSGSNNVSMYTIDATTGALTLIGTIGT